jgi:2',3'-cyclic-nucleotide 2'-phosphodiesterase (5'-nucleotidase family)
MEQGTLTIYHTNDIHNHGEIFKFFSNLEKDDSTLILDAGDALKGSHTLFYLKEKVLQEMNRVGYDAMTMGNREFNYIRDVIKSRTKEARFPILCANIVDMKNKVNGCYQEYIGKEINGVKVGLFGLTVVQYNDNSFWLPLFKFRFLDPLKTAETIIEKLREKVDLLVLLSHLGVDRDREIAEHTKGIDLIIGGHSHTLLETPIRIKDTWIFQAGSHGKNVGKISIIYPPEKCKSNCSIEYEIFKVEPGA